MENQCRISGLCLGLLLVDLAFGHPIDWDSADVQSVAAWTPLLAAAFLLTTVLLVAGCVCCRQNKGFQEFTDSASSHSLSATTGGYVNSAASEFTIFPPAQVASGSSSRLSVPGDRSSVVRFEPLPDIRLPQPQGRRPAAFNNVVSHGLSSQDWFQEPHVNFPRQHLKYVRELGRGWFGRVVEGEAQGIEPQQKTSNVVVKILHEDATTTDQMYFLHEVKPYRELQHPNILRLLGRCLETDPFLVLLEACPSGDLKSFLSQNIATADALNQQGVTLRMCCNVASGLQHMHDHGFVHTDLAARNCLVTPDLSVKVGDYGTSIETFKEDYYCAGEVALPIRWCAPETLHCTETTIETKEVTASANVWSLAVVLWEICEFGKLPYGELTDDEVIVRVLGEGTQRLGPPSLASPHGQNLYLLMKLCWSAMSKRPLLQQVHSMLNHLHTRQDGDCTSLKTDEDFERRWEMFKPNTIPKTDNHVPDTPVTQSPTHSTPSRNDDIPQHKSFVLASTTSRDSGNLTVDGTPLTTSPQPSLASSSGGEFFVPPLQQHHKSPSLQNLRGSIDDLSGSLSESQKWQRSDTLEGKEEKELEFEPDFDSWLKGVETTNEEDAKFVQKISEAIRDLDNALALEKTSSSSSEVSPHHSPAKHAHSVTLDFRLGRADSGVSSDDKELFQHDSLQDDSFLDNAKSGQVENRGTDSGTDTEDEMWRRRIERGEFSEKVKEKSKSVADLMILTHIECSDGSDSDPPSLTWSFERSANGRGSFTTRLNKNIPAIFNSESNIHGAVLGEEFKVTLQKLHDAQRENAKQYRAENFLANDASEEYDNSWEVESKVPKYGGNVNVPRNLVIADNGGSSEVSIKESDLVPSVVLGPCEDYTLDYFKGLKTTSSVDYCIDSWNRYLSSAFHQDEVAFDEISFKSGGDSLPDEDTHESKDIENVKTFDCHHDSDILQNDQSHELQSKLKTEHIQIDRDLVTFGLSEEAEVSDILPNSGSYKVEHELKLTTDDIKVDKDLAAFVFSEDAKVSDILQNVGLHTVGQELTMANIKVDKDLVIFGFSEDAKVDDILPSSGSHKLEQESKLTTEDIHVDRDLAAFALREDAKVSDILPNSGSYKVETKLMTEDQHIDKDLETLGFREDAEGSDILPNSGSHKVESNLTTEDIQNGKDLETLGFREDAKVNEILPNCGSHKVEQESKLTTEDIIIDKDFATFRFSKDAKVSDILRKSGPHKVESKLMSEDIQIGEDLETLGFSEDEKVDDILPNSGSHKVEQELKWTTEVIQVDKDLAAFALREDAKVSDIQPNSGSHKVETKLMAEDIHIGKDLETLGFREDAKVSDILPNSGSQNVESNLMTEDIQNGKNLETLGFREDAKVSDILPNCGSHKVEQESKLTTEDIKIEKDFATYGISKGAKVSDILPNSGSNKVEQESKLTSEDIQIGNDLETLGFREDTKVSDILPNYGLHKVELESKLTTEDIQFGKDLETLNFSEVAKVPNYGLHKVEQESKLPAKDIEIGKDLLGFREVAKASNILLNEVDLKSKLTTVDIKIDQDLGFSEGAKESDILQNDGPHNVGQESKSMIEDFKINNDLVIFDFSDVAKVSNFLQSDRSHKVEQILELTPEYFDNVKDLVSVGFSEGAKVTDILQNDEPELMLENIKIDKDSATFGFRENAKVCDILRNDGLNKVQLESRLQTEDIENEKNLPTFGSSEEAKVSVILHSILTVEDKDLATLGLSDDAKFQQESKLETLGLSDNEKLGGIDGLHKVEVDGIKIDLSLDDVKPVPPGVGIHKNAVDLGLLDVHLNFVPNQNTSDLCIPSLNFIAATPVPSGRNTPELSLDIAECVQDDSAEAEEEKSSDWFKESPNFCDTKLSDDTPEWPEDKQNGSCQTLMEDFLLGERLASVDDEGDDFGLDVAKHSTPDDERSSDSGFRDKGSLSESCEDACDEKYNLEDIEAELEETFNKGGFNYVDDDEEDQRKLSARSSEDSAYNYVEEEQEQVNDKQSGWYLHPPQNESGVCENSYVSFSLDEEFVTAIRNELREKLPCSRQQSCEEELEDEDCDQEERADITIHYNTFPVPLSPILEERESVSSTFSDLKQEGGSEPLSPVFVLDPKEDDASTKKFEQDIREALDSCSLSSDDTGSSCDKTRKQSSVLFEDLDEAHQMSLVQGTNRHLEDDDMLLVNTETNEVTLLESPKPKSHLAFVNNIQCDSGETFVIHGSRFETSSEDEVFTPDSISPEHAASSLQSPDTDNLSDFFLTPSEKSPSGSPQTPYLLYNVENPTFEEVQEIVANNEAAEIMTELENSGILSAMDRLDYLTSPSVEVFNGDKSDDQEWGTPSLKGLFEEDQLPSTKAPMPSPEEESWKQIPSMLAFSDLCSGKQVDEADLMSTSFSVGDDPECYTPDWETDSDETNEEDNNSSSSGEFIWKEGDRESSVKAIPTSNTFKPYEGLSDFPMEAIAEEEEDEDDDDMDESCSSGSGTEFVPSAWNSEATPNRSALRSPDKKSDQKKNVSFKKQKYHSVYEYPRETSDSDSEGFDSPTRRHWPYQQPQVDYSSFADWELMDGDVLPEGCAPDTDVDQEVPQSNSPRQLDFYKLSSVDYDFGNGMMSEDGEFFISSSARPFQFPASSGSQFFPGQLYHDFVTPDSGIIDIGIAVGVDSCEDEVDTTTNFAEHKPDSIKWDEDEKMSQSPMSPSGLGELRHTRDRLKLDLPATSTAFVLDPPAAGKRRSVETVKGEASLLDSGEETEDSGIESSNGRGGTHVC